MDGQRNTNLQIRSKHSKKVEVEGLAADKNLPASPFLLYRKLRCISYKAKSAPRGSHCGGREFVASRPAAGGESCDAGFYFIDMCAIIKRVGLKAYK